MIVKNDLCVTYIGKKSRFNIKNYCFLLKYLYEEVFIKELG